MKKTITKTITEEIEVEVNYPMFVKDNSGTIYALLAEEKYIEVIATKNLNWIKTINLPIWAFIDLLPSTEQEFLKAYSEANSVNVINYHNAFNKQNEFIERVSNDI